MSDPMTRDPNFSAPARSGTPPLQRRETAGSAQVSPYTDTTHPSHPTGARDYTPAPPELEPLTAKLVFNLRLINRASGDPYKALQCAFDTLKSALDRADHRNRPLADGWRWAAINILIALAHTIERKAHPDPWFRDSKNWRVNLNGWAPLRPVVTTFRLLNREEDSR